jgi:DNA-binding HxlR family transcriptional regulator
MIASARLRTLEAEGLLTRVRYQDRPPRFEYHLTEVGLSLAPIVATMREFGDRHLAGEARPPMVFHHTRGDEFHGVLACQSCGQAVRTGEVVRAES